MKRLLVLALAITAIAGTQLAQAQPSVDEARVAFHAVAPITKGACTSQDATPCSSFDTEAPATSDGLTSQYVFIIAIQPDQARGGITGVGFGLEVIGNVYLGWTLCAPQEFSSSGWPGDQEGNVVTWASCQNNLLENQYQAVLGFFSAYGYLDTSPELHIIPRPAEGATDIVDCNTSQQVIGDASMGKLMFTATGEGNGGCNPCLTDCAGVPVENTTWGKIKNNFGSGE